MEDNVISLLTDIANWDEDYSSTWLKIRAKKLLASLELQEEMSAEEILKPCIPFTNRFGIKCIKYNDAIEAIKYARLINK